MENNAPPLGKFKQIMLVCDQSIVFINKNFQELDEKTLFDIRKFKFQHFLFQTLNEKTFETILES